MSFEYPQHKFWMRNKENSFPIPTFIWRPDCILEQVYYFLHKPGPIAQLVASPIKDPDFAILILAQSHSFVEINYVFFYGHSPSCANSRKVGVRCKGKYVHNVLINRLVKLAQEKVWLGY